MTLLPEVVDVLEMVLRRDGSDVEMTRVGRGEYLRQVNKDQKGRPVQFYVDRGITPVINIWPTPENSTDQLIYYYVQRIDDAGLCLTRPRCRSAFIRARSPVSPITSG